MLDFSKLKAASGDIKRTQELINNLNKSNSDYEETNSSFWVPTKGKDGNAFAIIRFLPAPAVDGDDAVPFVKIYRHAFQGPVSQDWYVENCLSTIGRKDPVNDLTRLLYKSGTEFDKALGLKYKRQLKYVSNILVVKDEAKPENEGKIFRFKYGIKVFNKINEALFPKIGKSIDAYDMWKGADFAYDVNMQGDWPNYDACKFGDPAPISEDDDFMKKLWESEYSLKELLDEKNFKPYDELKTKLDSVLGFTYEERGSAYNAGRTAMSASPAGNFGPHMTTAASMEPTGHTTLSNPVVAKSNPMIDDSIPFDTAEDDAEMATIKALAAGNFGK